MTQSEKKAARGRPRKFDTEAALQTAQTLFHRHGYEGVSLSDLTGAMGITPPSFYAAFQSKAGLFGRALARYSASDGIPIADILQPGRDVVEALQALLLAAAERYGADPLVRGCMVLSGRAALEPEARQAACTLQAEAVRQIRAFVAQTVPAAADAVTAYIAVVMAGLSAEARAGAAPDVLLQAAKDAGHALPALLAAR